MKRSFWTIVLLATTLCGVWTLYVGAQELQKQITFGSDAEPKAQRFQFIEHFYLNNGEPFEVFLRLDRQTGQTWRYHATQSGWLATKEASGHGLEADHVERYELLSHVYRNPDGIQLERMLRVDYETGRSWAYDSQANQWSELAIEAAPAAEPQAAANAPAPK